MRRLELLLIAVLATAGCARGRKTSNAAPTTSPSVSSQQFQKLILTPETGLVGKVVRVNTDGRFVVMNFPIGHLPALDQRLNVYRLGLKTGEVRVTGPQYDDNIVGDVISGDAQRGDEVRER